MPVKLTGPPPGGFAFTINFDDLGEDVDVFDQYVSQGVRFRSQLSLFDSPLGEAPGETEDDAWVSSPFSLEVDEENGDTETAYLLFQIPVLAVGAMVGTEDFDFDEGLKPQIAITGYDSALTQVVGPFTVELPGEAGPAGKNWRFLGFTTDIPVSVVRFRHFPFDDDDGDPLDMDDEFYIEDVGVTPVPEPSTLALLGLGVVPFLLRRLWRSGTITPRASKPT